MNIHRIIRDFSAAVLAQGVSLAMSIASTLIVPKILGVEEYGYWQLFIFYCSYCGLFQLGLDDGVYLINGGRTRDELDKSSLASQFWVGQVYQWSISVVVIAIALLGNFGTERVFVIVCTAVFVIVQNAAYYFGYILQAVDETKKFSYSTIVERGTYLIPLVVLIVTRNPNFEPYVIAFIFSSIVQVGYCVWQVRDVMGTKLLSVQAAIRDTLTSIKVGSQLMFANVASSLNIGFARFAIDAVWGIKTFGMLSLALSIVTYFLQFISQASMVLFPALRKQSTVELRKFVSSLRAFMGLIFPGIYLLYFPVAWLLGLWLPQYANSFEYLALLLPICVFDSRMNLICTTYFKVMRKETRLFFINLVTAGASLVLSLVGTILVGSLYFVIIAMVVIIIIRSIVSESMVAHELGTSNYNLLIPELALTVYFVILARCLPYLLALGLYAVVYAIYLLLFRRDVIRVMSKLRHALGGVDEERI